MKPFLVWLFPLFFAFSGAAQTDSCGLRLSLLTCSPGQELYSTFGHSALRVQNPINGMDLVYNYGTFDFDDPYFLVKFVRGKLLYFLSVDDYSNFAAAYAWERRGIVEQVLQLTCEEKQQLAQALSVNLLPQNRSYKYDFLWDNCSTRLRDIVSRNTRQPLVFSSIIPEDAPTYRNLIHTYLDAGRQYWSKLGIDLLLGSRLDQQVTNTQAMFLPDYLKKGFDSAAIGRRSLVTPAETLLAAPAFTSEPGIFHPLYVFSFLLIAIGALSLIRFKSQRRTLALLDRILFLITGLTGILLLFMWLGTDHTVCKDNLNLAWALPMHAVAAFYLGSGKPWVRNYLRFSFVVQAILILTWFFLPQELNISLLPFVLLLVFRTGLLLKRPVKQLYA